MAGAVYYDGQTAQPKAVSLHLSNDDLEVRQAGETIARWPLRALRQQDAPPGTLRLALEEGPSTARVDVTDEIVTAEIKSRCPDLNRDVAWERPFRIVLWSFAAAASLIISALFLIPLMAEHLTPLVPYALERKLGEAVDNQVRLIFDGKECSEPAGRAALDKLFARLDHGGFGGTSSKTTKVIDPAGPEVGPDVIVLESEVENATALPGGRVYLFNGLLQKAEDSDEIAGVLAHELGHVVHRDGLHKLIQTGGTSFLLGLLFGDVTGGGTIVLMSRIMVDNAYSRDTERAADEFAVSTMLSLGRSPRAMGLLLKRIEKEEHTLPPFLSSHPVTEERLEALGRREPSQLKSPILSDEEWRALKHICKTT